MLTSFSRRRTGKSIKIGDEITATVLLVESNQSRNPWFDAPKDVAVHREAIYQRIEREAENGINSANEIVENKTRHRVLTNHVPPRLLPIGTATFNRTVLRLFTVLTALLAFSTASAEAINLTAITSLPATITTRGVHCLTGDLSTSITSTKAIEIQTNNVTIDMNGF